MPLVHAIFVKRISRCNLLSSLMKWNLVSGLSGKLHMDRSELRLLQTHLATFRGIFRKLTIIFTVSFCPIWYIFNSLIENAMPSPVTVFMEATPSCLLVNKTQILSLTQKRFILIKFLHLHECYMFRPVLRPSSGIST